MKAANIVVDLPEGTAAEDAACALNAPGEGYFLVQVLPVLGGHRAYLRRYKQTPSKAETVAAKVEAVDEATALSIVRANMQAPVRTIVDVLAKAGIKRGRSWVSDQLTVVLTEDGREEEARAYVMESCGDSHDAKEVVDELATPSRYRKPIKRTRAWAQRKLDEKRGLVRADKSLRGQGRPRL
jgi:hypothetical protein